MSCESSEPKSSHRTNTGVRDEDRLIDLSEEVIGRLDESSRATVAMRMQRYEWQVRV